MKSIHWLHYWGYLSQIISRESILGRAAGGGGGSRSRIVQVTMEIGGAQAAGVAGTMNYVLKCSFSVCPSRP